MFYNVVVTTSYCILNLLFFILLQVFHEDFVLIHVLLTPVIFFAPFRPSQSTQFTQSSQFTQFVIFASHTVVATYTLCSLYSRYNLAIVATLHPHEFSAAEQLTQSLQSDTLCSLCSRYNPRIVATLALTRFFAAEQLTQSLQS